MNGEPPLPLEPSGLAAIVWGLAVALLVGAMVNRRAQASKERYFLAGRTQPWWWAGASNCNTSCGRCPGS